MMKHATWAALLLMLTAAAVADERQFVFPAKGQTPDQQKQEEFECYQWAAQQSGFDPLVAARQPASTTSTTTQSAPPQQTQSSSAGKEVVKGAAAGALVAEATGAEADDGAGAGAVIGLRKARKQQRQQQRQAAKEQAQAEEQAQAKAAEFGAKREDYKRANAACLEAKGYTVR